LYVLLATSYHDRVLGLGHTTTRVVAMMVTVCIPSDNAAGGWGLTPSTILLGRNINDCSAHHIVLGSMMKHMVATYIVSHTQWSKMSGAVVILSAQWQWQ
jgi:hypothetical protein